MVGYSAGYDVIDPQGRVWDVKTGDEAQPEVVASRERMNDRAEPFQ